MDAKIGKKGGTCKLFRSPHVFLPFDVDFAVDFRYLGRVGGPDAASYDPDMASVLCFSCNDLSISVYTVSANSFLVRSVLWVMPDRVRPDNCDRAFKIPFSFLLFLLFPTLFNIM